MNQNHNTIIYTDTPYTPQKKYLGDEDFRVVSTWGQVDPIGVTRGKIPFTPTEASRFTEWKWVWGRDEGKGCDCRSSGGCEGGEGVVSPMGGMPFW